MVLGSNIIIILGIVIVSRAGDSTGMIAVGAIIFGIGFGGCFPAYATLVRDNLPAGEFGFWLSTLWFASFLSAGVGTWTGGYLHDVTGNYGYSLAFAAITIVVGCVIAQVSASSRLPVASSV